MGRFLCIHGHFYQPPRENPWLETVEVQDSAYPFHDWNQRVTAECYAPNSASRILDEHGDIAEIANNYARISFNFGPTLLAWLGSKEPEIRTAIQVADSESCQRFSGHGSALAQAYNHMILPLASTRDKLTQVLWGLVDFRHHYGREAEGMWLPETAVDLETLEILAGAGLRFSVLAPHQAARSRRIGERGWHDVSGARIDPKRPYVLTLPSGKTITLFFYDGPISRAVAFERLLSDGSHFARRLIGGFIDGGDADQLVHIATDGETYGHHHRFGDMALAWALHHIERNRLATLTNYGEYLERHPPTHEVEILERTSWSCAHGIERWRSDCGCNTGGHLGWRQGWRGPLREALDWLRERVTEVWQRRAGELLADLWRARDEYINVILDRSRPNVEAYLARHARHPLSADEQVTALQLCEMQRHAMLMYTSCGWFFDDVAGIETVQVLQYAGRALQLAQRFCSEPLELELLARLAKASGNQPAFADGAAVYQAQVKPAMADLDKVAAHCALSSLFEEYNSHASIFGFVVERQEYRANEAGRSRLATGRLRVTSEVTWASSQLSFAALHFGDHNLSGGVRNFTDERTHQVAVGELQAAFARADLPAVIRLLDRYFGSTYSLKTLFRDEQRKILTQILEATLDDITSTYQQLYENQAPLMRFLVDLQVPLPSSLLAAAELVTNRELRDLLRAATLDLERIHALLEQARLFGVQLDRAGLAFVLRTTLAESAEHFLDAPLELARLQELTGGVGLADSLPFDVDLWRVQNAYFQLPEAIVRAARERAATGDRMARRWIACVAILGKLLHVRVVGGEPPEEWLTDLDEDV